MAVRRTNRGVKIDLEDMAAKFSDLPAVGNMNVNARGDVLGRNGEIIKRSEERVREYYRANPKVNTEKVSLKKGITESQTVRDEPAVPTPPPAAEPQYREVELPNGDIKMVPVDEWEEPNA